MAPLASRAPLTRPTKRTTYFRKSLPRGLPGLAMGLLTPRFSVIVAQRRVGAGTWARHLVPGESDRTVPPRLSDRRGRSGGAPVAPGGRFVYSCGVSRALLRGRDRWPGDCARGWCPTAGWRAWPPRAGGRGPPSAGGHGTAGPGRRPPDRRSSTP